MSLRRHGNTDAQEEALGEVEEAAKALGFKLGYGTAVGKNPQAILLDHEPEDGLVRVNSDGEVKFGGQVLIPVQKGDFARDLADAIGKYRERRIPFPKPNDKPVGDVCMYCGFSRMDDQPKTKAKVGRVGYLDVGQEAAQKVGRLQLANNPYTLEVCPACGAIIGVIEKKGRRQQDGSAGQ